MKILGIDPGLQICGYGCLQTDDCQAKLIEAGVFRTNNNQPIEQRLNSIANDMESLLGKLTPEMVAVEELYSHYAHPKTSILMGHARGVILQTCARFSIEVKSFAATKIKKSVTGNGRASKQQMQMAVQTLLALPSLPQPPDVADAIAIALCCTDSLKTTVV